MTDAELFAGINNYRTRREGDCKVWVGSHAGKTPQLSRPLEGSNNPRVLIWNRLHPDNRVANSFELEMVCETPLCVTPGHFRKRASGDPLANCAATLSARTKTDAPCCVDCGALVPVPSYMGGALTKVRCKACSPSTDPGSPAAEEIVRRVASGEITAVATKASREAKALSGDGAAVELADHTAIQAEEEGSPIGSASASSVSEVKPSATTPMGARLFEAVTFAMFNQYGSPAVRALFNACEDLYICRLDMEATDVS